MRRLIPALTVLPLLLGCSAPAFVPSSTSVSLPPDATTGAGDPTRSAIVTTAYAFNTPGALAGRPADAARAVAEIEYLAAELSSGPRWVRFSGNVAVQMREAQAELRGVLGVPANVPNQAVIDSLFAAGRALNAGDRAGAARVLPPQIFPNGPDAVVARLTQLPPLPKTQFATNLAENMLSRGDFEDRRGSRSGL